MDKKAVAIVVGGGPAPGINGVISAATINALNHGHKVYGIRNGFEDIMRGDLDCVGELSINDVSVIPSQGGSILRTSRANPTKSEEALQTVVESLKGLGVGYLVTIGGDDTAKSASGVAQAAGGEIAVGHVPKTIDNDLPLPSTDSTFGFQSAREAGTDIVETLLTDARTTRRWFFVEAMGRKAGHLALGIGVSGEATITIIPEEFKDEKIPLSSLVDILVGSIIKRLAMGREHGVAVLAEGLAEQLDPESLPQLDSIERDDHGNIRFSELDFGSIVRKATLERLEQLGVKMKIVHKNVGYELRCCPPTAFDREYTRELGYGIVEFLLEGGTDAMISRQGDDLVPIPFNELIDSKTGKTRIRMVDTASVLYLVARKYMIRLTEDDLKQEVFLKKLSAVTNLSSEQLVEQFMDTARAYGLYGRGFGRQS